MMWTADPLPHAPGALEEALATDVATLCGGVDEPAAERLREVARGVAAYATRASACPDVAALRRLACRALHATGEGRLARRVGVFGSGLARPAGWLVAGRDPLWVLDVRPLVRGRRERLELALFGGLDLALDALVHVWDDTAGRGCLGLNHVREAAAAVLASPARGRAAARLGREVCGVCAARLERARAARGWQATPAILQLGA